MHGAAPMTTRPQKITFGQLCEMGVRDVLIYCRDYKCSHSIKMNADRWPDEVRLSDIEDRFICTVSTAFGRYDQLSGSRQIALGQSSERSGGYA
jgi:hypothetical protein